MITGKITYHEEPTKYVAPMHNLPVIARPYNKYTMEQKESILKTVLEVARDRGLVQGARVRRKHGVHSTGSITFVYESIHTAFSSSNGECEPFKVVWDASNGPSYGFCYAASDLELIAE